MHNTKIALPAPEFAYARYIARYIYAIWHIAPAFGVRNNTFYRSRSDGVAAIRANPSQDGDAKPKGLPLRASLQVRQPGRRTVAGYREGPLRPETRWEGANARPRTLPLKESASAAVLRRELPCGMWARVCEKGNHCEREEPLLA
jgi:hypothetical protein